MRDNVTIKVFEHGELVRVVRGHNVWLPKGEEWLSNMLGYASHNPDAPEDNRRVRYLGVGVGGNKQGLQAMVLSSPISDAYPLPVAPNSTTGFDFRKEIPIDPAILTLEAPVRISGSSNPTPQPADVWLVDTPNIYFSHATLYELTVHAVVDGTAGDVVYPPLTSMPLSEVALFLGDADKNEQLNEAVAYYSFATILLNAYVRLEFIWSVGF